MTDTENTNATTRIPHVDASTMQLRLNTEKFLQDIEIFLTGEEVTYIEDSQGNIQTDTVMRGLRKANSNGVGSIYNKVKSIVNVHTVQGNFPVDANGYSDAYENFCLHLHLYLAQDLMLKLYTYDIRSDDYDELVNYIMDSVRLFLTRPIGNEERINYTHTIQSQERNTINEQKPKMWSLT